MLGGFAFLFLKRQRGSASRNEEELDQVINLASCPMTWENWFLLKNLS